VFEPEELPVVLLSVLYSEATSAGRRGCCRTAKSDNDEGGRVAGPEVSVNPNPREASAIRLGLLARVDGRGIGGAGFGMYIVKGLSHLGSIVLTGLNMASISVSVVLVP